MDKYQTFWRRVGAVILDSLILMPVGWLVSSIFLFFGFTPKIVPVILPGFISVSYYILMHAYFGQTIGKMAVKVKVLDDIETPINFGQAILRSLPQLFPIMFAVSFSTAGEAAEDTIATWSGIIYGLLSLFSVADAIVFLSNEKRRALHDFIAGTIVIRTDV